jgi:hypothetical protein
MLKEYFELKKVETMKLLLYSLLFALTCFIGVNHHAFGQGLNNDYQIDQTDLKAVFEMQNI